jgi:hypothetical protein
MNPVVLRRSPYNRFHVSGGSQCRSHKLLLLPRWMEHFESRGAPEVGKRNTPLCGRISMIFKARFFVQNVILGICRVREKVPLASSSMSGSTNPGLFETRLSRTMRLWNTLMGFQNTVLPQQCMGCGLSGSSIL